MSSGKSKIPGVPHTETKVMPGCAYATGGLVGGLPAAPRPRQNMLNVRVAPLKRLTSQVKAVKPEKFGFTE